MEKNNVDHLLDEVENIDYFIALLDIFSDILTPALDHFNVHFRAAHFANKINSVLDQDLLDQDLLIKTF